MERIINAFKHIFERMPEVRCFAPGRVNLIGEHTDYNGGYVFPCAINPGIECAAARRKDRKLRFYSCNYPDNGIIEYSLDALKLADSWADNPVSVIKTFSAFGHKPETGADFLFMSDLPVGAGLSSSAALEVSVGMAIRELFSIPVTNQETAIIGQFAENRFLGVNCGIMDQFASAVSRQGCAVLLNSNTLECEFVPIADAAIVIVNSRIKHSLAATEYNRRRQECEQAQRELGVPSLCSLDTDDFDSIEYLISDDTCKKRARHVVYENSRTLRAAALMKNGDLEGFGRLMNESHKSLRDDFQVSCRALDHLAAHAQSISGVYGARMTGGGFGGCTVNLMKAEAVSEFIEKISSQYESRFFIRPDIYCVKAVNGAAIL